jgi:arylsulfatase A-like enzyme
MKNLILVVFDCLRADFCFPNGPPFIEQLKEKGESYTQYISVATCTVPCFATMLTGLYPETHGIKGHPDKRSMITDSEWSLKKEVVTLPMILRNHGYHTYAEVSDPLITQFHLDRGFDHYHVRDQKTNKLLPDFFKYLKSIVDGFQQPYFFLLHLFELHGRTSQEIFKKQCETLEQLLKDKQDMILAVTGDHGEQLGKGAQHGFHIQEHLVRVPLIIAGESIEKVAITGQYSQVDLLPLLLAKLNIPINLPYRLPGGIRLRKYAYMRAIGAPLKEQNWMVGMRTEQYKFITHPRNKDVHDELYGLPDEKPVLITEHSEIADELLGKLQEVMRDAEHLRIGDSNEWTEEDEKLVLSKMRELKYID